MTKKFPIAPKHPERICWGCSQYCPADDLQCGNGCERIQHPIELDGDLWYQKGDWSNLLTQQQLDKLHHNSHQATSPSKPHIKLSIVKNKS